MVHSYVCIQIWGLPTFVRLIETVIQILLENHVKSVEQMALIHLQLTARQKAALRTQYGVKDIPNALLELPIDIHKYTCIIFLECKAAIWHFMYLTGVH